MNKIEDMREHYDLSTLDEQHVDADAMKQFHVWFNEARKAEVLEPNAMTLSTIDKDGNPASRTVLLKGLETDRFLFYTNYNSDKAQEIESHSAIALLFLWKKLQRQVRITGFAKKTTKEQSQAYFNSRPKGSQLGAWVSPQSQVIPNKDFLANRKEDMIKKFMDVANVPLPDFWGGYYLKPEKIEFWQGRPNRLHDRLRYRRVDGNWIIERLAP
ncbi:MAG: pyridoxamine 5'-phosphate oxidase [Saprospiraceae bacterium]|nr:pyridoxamine 5'-phosphate oxidase [Saprospiraceae bacterium]